MPSNRYISVLAHNNVAGNVAGNLPSQSTAEAHQFTARLPQLLKFRLDRLPPPVKPQVILLFVHQLPFHLALRSPSRTHFGRDPRPAMVAVIAT